MNTNNAPASAQTPSPAMPSFRPPPSTPAFARPGPLRAPQAQASTSQSEITPVDPPAPVINPTTSDMSSTGSKSFFKAIFNKSTDQLYVGSTALIGTIIGALVNGKDGAIIGGGISLELAMITKGIGNKVCK